MLDGVQDKEWSVQSVKLGLEHRDLSQLTDSCLACSRFAHVVSFVTRTAYARIAIFR